MLKTKEKLQENKNPDPSENFQGAAASSSTSSNISSAAALETHGIFPASSSSATLLDVLTKSTNSVCHLPPGAYSIGNVGPITTVAHGPNARAVAVNNVQVNPVTVHTRSGDVAARVLVLAGGNPSARPITISDSSASQSSSTSSTSSSNHSGPTAIASGIQMGPGSSIIVAAITGHATFQMPGMEMGDDRKNRLADIETRVRGALIQKYSGWETVKGLFEEGTIELKPEYINLELLSDVKLKKKTSKNAEAENEGSDPEGGSEREIRNERLSSYEDLFGDRRNLAIENVFKSDWELFSPEELENSSGKERSTCKPKTILVQGRAGIGKTTLAKYISQAWAQGKQSSAVQPDNRDENDNDAEGIPVKPKVGLYPEFDWVFILLLRELGQAKYQSRKQLTLREWIHKSHFAVLDIDENDFKRLWTERIEPALKQGKGLIILEGYDELPEEHDCQDILAYLINNDSVNGFSNTPKLITSRPHATTTLTKDRNIEVIGFNNASIECYVNIYFNDNPNYGKELLKLLRQQPCLWSNAHIPITLNIICWILKEDSRSKVTEGKIAFPKAFNTMTGLYDELMLMKLLARGYENEKHNNPRLTALSDFESTQSRQLLKHYAKALRCLYTIAYWGVEGSETALLSGQCIEQALIECRIEPDEIDPMLKQLLGIGLLRPIVVDPDGKPLTRAKQAYEFLHFTFQEFLAAHYISEKLVSNDNTECQKMQEVVLNQKLNPRYQIVWWFVAGLCKTPESQRQFVDLLQGERPNQASSSQPHSVKNALKLNRDIFGHYELGLLVRCAEEFVGAEDSPWVNHIVTQVQRKIADLVKLYQQDWLPENYSSPFLSSLRISTKLIRLKGEKDLFAKGAKALNKDRIEGSFAFIGWLKLSTPWVMEFLSRGLGNSSKFVCRNAAVTIGRIGASVATPEILSALQKLLRDKNQRVSEDVIVAIGDLGVSAATPEMLSGLLKLLDDEDRGVRDSAAVVIGDLGVSAATPEILPRLLKLLDDEDERVRSCGAAAVGNFGASTATPEMLLGLLKLLDDKDREVRRRAVDAIGNLGASAATPEVLAGLLKLLGDKDGWAFGWLRSSTAVAIGRLGASAATPEMLSGLLKILGDENEGVRRSASKAIGNLGVGAETPEMLSGLLNLLKDKDKGVRESSAITIGRLGVIAATPEILSALLNLLDDEATEVRGNAAVTIGHIGASAATREMLSGLLKLLDDKDVGVRRRATVAIGHLGTRVAMPEMLSGLLKLLDDKDEGVRILAAEAIGRLGAWAITPEVLSGLLQLLDDKDEGVRCGAAGVIGNLGASAVTQEMLSGLLKLLGDKNKWVRSSAAAAVGCLGASAATPKILLGLLQLLGDENDREIVEKAAVAISKLGVSVLKPVILGELFVLLVNTKNKYHINKLLTDITKNHCRHLITTWSQEFKTNPSSTESQKCLAAIFYGAEMSGVCHLQITDDAEAKWYYLTGYADKEKIKIELTKLQARYLQEFNWKVVLDTLKIKANHREAVLASSSSSTPIYNNPLSIFATQVSAAITLNYQFQLTPLEATKIIIANTQGESSGSEIDTRLLVLKELFIDVLTDMSLQNDVELEVYKDASEHAQVDTLCLTGDNPKTVNRVATLLKEASGNHLRESLTHSFFGTSEYETASTSESKYSIQCALQ